MSSFVIPRDEIAWPTLGPQVCSWLEANAVFGPGDLRGEPLVLDDELRGLIFSYYEVFPAVHARAGRRRYKRCSTVLNKGSRKTELAALLAFAELHPEAPVRCDGFDPTGQPVGRGVRDPFIVLLAITEEQSDELAFRALYTIVREGPRAADFRIGLDRIDRKAGDGRAVALAGAPDARDGARLSFAVFDEVGRMDAPRLVEAHDIIVAGLAKRKAADAWAFEIGTAHVPGEGSVGESTAIYAESVARGEVADPALFYFARRASDDHDLGTADGVRAAVLEACGPTAAWRDVDAIVAQWSDPTRDRTQLARLWLNQATQSSGQAFDIERWRELAKPDYIPEPSSLIVLGFDGSARSDDAALLGVEVESGFVWPIGVWPQSEDAWDEVRAEVTATVAEVFDEYRVWALFANADYWSDTVSAWAARFRQSKRERVVIFDAFRSRRKFASAIRTFTAAIETGELSHDGDPVLESHLGNARRAATRLAAEDGQELYTIRKERSDSPNTIDAAVAAIIAWEARAACTAAGVTGRSVYEDRGIVYV